MTHPQQKPHLDALAITLLLVCCAFWGYQQILIKSTLAEVPPLWQAFLRFGGATIVLLLWCAARGIPLWRADGSWRGGLLVGTLFSLEFVCIYLGLRFTSASRVTIFLYTSPFVVALLLPRLVPGEHLRRQQWLGLVLAFGAVALAFSEGLSQQTPTHAGSWRGDLLALLGGLFWGLTTLAVKATAVARLCAEKAQLYQVAVTSLVLPSVSLALGETWSLNYSAQAWTSIVIQAVVGAFASYLTWMWMLRHYPATHMSTFAFLTPVFALAFGVMLLDEPLTLRLIIALFGVAAGIVLVSRRA